MITLQRGLALVLVALLAAIGVVLLTSRSSDSAAPQPVTSSPFDGPTMPPGLRAANFSLLDQYGHRVSLAHYRGRVVVLTFIHSLCHDTCPFMVEQIKGALNDLPGRRGLGPGDRDLGRALRGHAREPDQVPAQARDERPPRLRQRHGGAAEAGVARLRDRSP